MRIYRSCEEMRKNVTGADSLHALHELHGLHLGRCGATMQRIRLHGFAARDRVRRDWVIIAKTTLAW